MTNPTTVAVEPRERGVPAENGAARKSSPGGDALSTSLCCLAGGAIAALAVLLSLPTLLDLTRPFGGLSSTAIAFVLLFAWLVAWAVVEFTWETLTNPFE